MPTDATPRRWESLHLHSYGDLSDLMLRTRPALNLLARLGRPAYVTRHWACGPHVLLHLQVLDGEAAFPRPLLDDITRTLRDLPDAALTPFDWEWAARVYPQLAHHEQFPGRYWPPLPHGHLYTWTRQRAVGVRGSRLTENLIDDACVALNGVILSGLRQVASGLPLTDLCFDLMIATADRTAPDTELSNGFLSYRSHAEIFLINVPDTVRARFDDLYTRQREQLARRLDRALQRSEGNDLITAWRRHLGEAHALAWEGLTSGEIDLSWEAQDFSLHREDMAPALERSRRSAFHRTELANLENLRRRSQDVSFNAYRVLLNVQYLQFSRLGLSPVQRALLCHLVSNAVEERYGINAVELASGYTYLTGTPT